MKATNNPYWYKDAIIYELHVRAFVDSDGDGIGDFCGLTGKLAYLQDLGVTALWLLPFYPSPLRDDGYDIADYTAVHPRYGSLEDAQHFIEEAHRRGLRVITELVLNHTSDQHPWFQRARRAEPGSAERDFYVWSDDPERYQEARIIFPDFENSNWTWDPVANAYFWHRFYSHQPDLNFDSPHVQQAIFAVVDFWLKLGVDGLRLDAVPYLYEREGTTGENLITTHTFLKRLRSHIDRHFPGRMILAEANQWPEDAAAYFGDGDECNMAFHFPLMPRLFMATRMEDRFPVVDILDQTPELPESAQWAIFLRNHDELTLEMVTDEERVFMYRAYARDEEARINLGIRRRLAPLLGNNRRRIELMNGLLFALPGTPVIYYGDEIGMGDNMFLGDRNGVRTPMQWSPDRNAGFSRANPQRLFLPLVMDHEYHYETVNVESQMRNPSSLLAWMRRLIALRKRYACFGRGTLRMLDPSNPRVLAFIRQYEGECVLVVANLSRFVQMAELDLQAFSAMIPVEMFGRVEFPPINDESYMITLGPHSFYWFALTPAATGASQLQSTPTTLPELVLDGDWDNLISGEARAALSELLPTYLAQASWFGGKARRIIGVRMLDAIVVPAGRTSAYLTFWRVDYAAGEAEVYQLPLAFAQGKSAAEVEERAAHALIARLHCTQGKRKVEGLLYDAFYSGEVALALLEAIAARSRLPGQNGTAAGEQYRQIAGAAAHPPLPRWIAGSQNNSSLIFDERMVLKLLRRIDEGPSPELELGVFLGKRQVPHVAQLLGALSYENRMRGPSTLAVLHDAVAHDNDGHSMALAALQDSLARATAQQPLPNPSPCGQTLLGLALELPSAQAQAILGSYQPIAELIGRRTAELHQALAADSEDPNFAPDYFTPFNRRALYQSMRNLAGRTIGMLRRQQAHLPAEAQAAAAEVLGHEQAVIKRFQSILQRPFQARRIRTHGDYHLEQVLHTADDLVIIDFEGEPSRLAAYRRLRHSPLQDVVAMIRSFFDVAGTLLYQQSDAERAAVEPHAHAWAQWASATFLQAYMELAVAEGFAPAKRNDQAAMLDIFLLERVLYEIQYDLNNRPERVAIALHSARRMLRME